MIRESPHCTPLVAALTFAVLAASALAEPLTDTFPIETDAYIDSRDPIYNYGVSTTAKVVVNGLDNSLCRVLFQLPEAAWSIPADRIISANVWFYVWFDQTASRTVRLHPLTTCFAEGTGDGTLSGDGATWLTRDGTTLWQSAGGDYDPIVWVNAVETANWFSWDIADLWEDAHLRACGAMLRMNDESFVGAQGMPRAPFTSSDGPSSQQPYLEVVYQPAPGDFDADGDVDLDDYQVLYPCLTGQNQPYAQPDCGAADLDVDGDVDLADFALFAAEFTGP